jgi:hypothetical protein
MVSPATISGLIVLLATHPSIDLQFKDIAKRCGQGLSRENRQLFGKDVLTCFALPTRTARTIASIGAALLVGLSGSARALKAGSSDVVLMDLQYAPQVLASASYPTMEGTIIDVAKQERVGLFARLR